MTDQEQREKEMEEFKIQCKKRIVELDEYFKTNPVKDGKYWHERMEYVSCVNCAKDYGTMAEWDLDYMRVCVECMESIKKNFPELFPKWKEIWGCFVMDTAGEARCRLGYQYHPKYECAPEDKVRWEEIIELWHKYHEITKPI